MQFVTFRLADSLPQCRLRSLADLYQSFKALNPEPWDAATAGRYRRIIGSREEKLLDKGYGECILRRADIRKTVTDALHFHDSGHYSLMAYVVMPNHVHLLICLADDADLSKSLHSIKSFTSKRINAQLGRTGQIWIKESYDRLVRSQDHYTHCLRYIASNPRHLPSSDYSLYFRQGGI